MQRIDWIRHHKRLSILNLPNGVSLNEFVNLHESGKITVTLSSSVTVGSFVEGRIGLREDLVEASDFLKNLNKIVRLTIKI